MAAETTWRRIGGQAWSRAGVGRLLKRLAA
jgi:hypothetical protein